MCATSDQNRNLKAKIISYKQNRSEVNRDNKSLGEEHHTSKRIKPSEEKLNCLKHKKKRRQGKVYNLEFLYM